MALLLGWFILASPAGVRALHAQETNQAGLVVVHGDGTVATRCVDFSEPQISGEELLRRSGFSILSEPTSMGMTVCSLDGEGCNFPAEGCFCQCQGGACTYWSYWMRPTGSGWGYSNQGATSSVILPGAIAGWRWGVADPGQAATMPEVAINQICALPTATSTDTPSPIPSETPSATPTETPSYTPTETPTESPTETPTEVPSETPTPSPTFTPSPTLWDTPIPLPTATPTFTPSPTPSPTETPTSTPIVAAEIVDTPAPPTPEALPTTPPTDTPVAIAVLRQPAASQSSGARVWLPNVTRPEPSPTQSQPVATVTLPMTAPPPIVAEVVIAPAPDSPLVVAMQEAPFAPVPASVARAAQQNSQVAGGQTGFALLFLGIVALAGAGLAVFVGIFVWAVMRDTGR